MSMGAYDEDEHERRERKAATVDAAFDSDRTVYEGTVEHDAGASTDTLLDTFEEIKD